MLQRLERAGQLSGSAAEQKRILAVPMPDMTPALKAMVGAGSCLTLRMTLEAQRLATALDAPTTTKSLHGVQAADARHVVGPSSSYRCRSKN